jgi:hypothetical protein
MKLSYIQLNNKKYLATKNKIHNFVVKFKQMYLQKKSIGIYYMKNEQVEDVFNKIE